MANWWESAPLAPQAPASAGGNWWDAAPRADEAGKEPPASAIDTVKRKLGLGVRETAIGLAQSLPGMVYDAAAVPVNAGISAYNALTGSNRAQIPPLAQMAAQGADAAGLPTPETTGERMVGAINRGGASMIPSMGAGALMSGSSNPLVSGSGQMLAAQPAGQMAAGMGGGAGSQAAAEMKLGPVAQAVGGVAGAVAAPLALAGAGRLISPNVRPEVAEFVERGGTPTYRQIMGQADDPAARLPGTGNMVREAERRSVQDFGRIAGNEAAEQMGARLSPNATGNAIPSELKTLTDAAYKSVAPRFTGALDDRFIEDVSLVSRIAKSLPAEERAALDAIIKQELSSVPVGQKVDGARLLELKRTFRDLAYDANGKLRDAYRAVEDSVSSLMERISPEGASELKGIDAAYARYLPIRNAASKSLAAGEFTPPQLARGAAKYAGEDAAARGVAPMQPTAQMGIGVMGERAFPQAPQPMGLMDMLQHPLATAGGYLRTPMYTPTGQAWTAQLMTGRQGAYYKALADALRLPGAGPIGLAAAPR